VTVNVAQGDLDDEAVKAVAGAAARASMAEPPKARRPTTLAAERSIVTDSERRLVIFGASNILSDLFDCALANGILPVKVVMHLPEDRDERSIPVASRVAQLAPLCAPPSIVPMSAFQPEENELYLLGPTTPTRSALAAELDERFQLAFHTLVHPTAYVSPLAKLGAGTFVGARSVIAAGATLGEHVFVNRGVAIGHDTRIGDFSRIQPGVRSAASRGSDVASRSASARR
jgi:hypothetical protein